ncbi:MAG: hypothetical protein H6607_06145 [Flavobacteriales bacterium]|nr:hypothetical protein [Flavobacteriales bacterium]
MSVLKKILGYLTLKKDEEFGDTSFTKPMHRINKISIFMFLFAIIILLIKFAF